MELFKNFLFALKFEGWDGVRYRLVRRIQRLLNPSKAITNYFQTNYTKNCLIVYVREPFERKLKNYHQNVVQVKIISQIISNLKYNVDILDYRDENVKFSKKYDAIFTIKVQDDMENIVKEKAKKIVYFTTSEPITANSAENNRIANVNKRKDGNITSERIECEFSKVIESFDSAIMIGNERNLDTYRRKYQLENTFLVPNTGYSFDWAFDRKRADSKSFLFFGSNGSVHRGLDLLLDVFSEYEFPCELYVCGRFEEETNFKKLYQKELFDSKNIHPIGFVNIESEEFKEICQLCTYIILPSCAEGQSGAIVTCMSAGLIPICSRECGFDDEDVFILTDCSHDSIREAVIDFSGKDKEWIEKESRRAIELTKTKYCIENFENKMKEALTSVLKYEE